MKVLFSASGVHDFCVLCARSVQIDGLRAAGLGRRACVDRAACEAERRRRQAIEAKAIRRAPSFGALRRLAGYVSRKERE